MLRLLPGKTRIQTEYSCIGKTKYLRNFIKNELIIDTSHLAKNYQ